MYRAGITYRFSIAALAYVMEPPRQQEYVMDNPDAIRRIRAREAWATQYGTCKASDEPAALTAWSKLHPEDTAPIRIRADRMTALLPGTNGAGDDASYSGEVVSVTPNAGRVLDTNFWRVDVNLLRSDDGKTVAVPVYVAENLFAGEWRPQPGEFVSGSLWLQGYATGVVAAG